MKHYCPEWDFDLIAPGDWEWESCICNFNPLWFWEVYPSE